MLIESCVDVASQLVTLPSKLVEVVLSAVRGKLAVVENSPAYELGTVDMHILLKLSLSCPSEGSKGDTIIRTSMGYAILYSVIRDDKIKIAQKQQVQ